MKRVDVITILLSLLGILMTLALRNIPAVTQDSDTVLRFSPPALGLRPDNQGTVSIVVENVQNLYGLEFQLAFDPDILEVIDADPSEKGVQIKPATWWKDGFVAVNQVDNGSGRIDFAATLLRPAQPASGNRAVATITFAARKTGTSLLSVASAILSTRNAEAIPYTTQKGGNRSQSERRGARYPCQHPANRACARPAGAGRSSHPDAFIYPGLVHLCDTTQEVMVPGG